MWGQLEMSHETWYWYWYFVDVFSEDYEFLLPAEEKFHRYVAVKTSHTEHIDEMSPNYRRANFTSYDIKLHRWYPSISLYFC